MKKLVLSFAAICAAVSLNAQYNITGPIPINNFSGGTLAPVVQGTAGTFQVSGQTLPQVTGTLTSVAIDAILTASVAGTFANDLAVVVTTTSDLATTTVLLQVGGFSNFTANKFAWGCEPACDVATLSTAVTGNVSAFTGIDFTASTYVVWIGNGYVDANPATNSGSWTLNSLSLGGVTSTASINENVISTSVYPNPANDVLNIVASEEIANVSILGLDGKVVATSTTSTVNVADLVSGMYIYEVTTSTGKVSRDSFMKK